MGGSIANHRRLKCSMVPKGGTYTRTQPSQRLCVDWSIGIIHVTAHVGRMSAQGILDRPRKWPKTEKPLHFTWWITKIYNERLRYFFWLHANSVRTCTHNAKHVLGSMKTKKEKICENGTSVRRIKLKENFYLYFVCFVVLFSSNLMMYNPYRSSLQNSPWLI